MGHVRRRGAKEEREKLMAKGHGEHGGLQRLAKTCGACTASRGEGREGEAPASPLMVMKRSSSFSLPHFSLPSSIMEDERGADSIIEQAGSCDE